MPRASRRDHLIETAITLFCEKGYHATGIDTILAKAKMSKKTMYNYFRSKDELIYAALRHYDSVYRNNFMKAVEQSGETPKERLLAMFDVAEQCFQEDDFFGCMFVNAIGEFSEQDSQVREISKQFKQQMWNYIANLTKEAGAQNAEELTDELCLLLEGATITCLLYTSPSPRDRTRSRMPSSA